MPSGAPPKMKSSFKGVWGICPNKQGAAPQSSIEPWQSAEGRLGNPKDFQPKHKFHRQAKLYVLSLSDQKGIACPERSAFRHSISLMDESSIILVHMRSASAGL